MQLLIDADFVPAVKNAVATIARIRVSGIRILHLSPLAFTIQMNGRYGEVIAQMSLKPDGCIHFRCESFFTVFLPTDHFFKTVMAVPDHYECNVSINIQDALDENVVGGAGTALTPNAMPLTRVGALPILNVNIWRYRVAVGIESRRFRNILMNMRFAQGLDSFSVDTNQWVGIFITNLVVRFYLKNHMVTLRRERGECKIEGGEDGELYSSGFSLLRLSAYYQASFSSENDVWMYEYEGSASAMFKFPLGSSEELGYLLLPGGPGL